MPGPKGSPRLEEAARLLISNDALTTEAALRASGYSKRQAAERTRQQNASMKKRRLLQRDVQRKQHEKSSEYYENKKKARKEREERHEREDAARQERQERQGVPCDVSVSTGSTVSSLSNDPAFREAAPSSSRVAPSSSSSSSSSTRGASRQQALGKRKGLPPLVPKPNLSSKSIASSSRRTPAQKRQKRIEINEYNDKKKRPLRQHSKR